MKQLRVKQNGKLKNRYLGEDLVKFYIQILQVLKQDKKISNTGQVWKLYSIPHLILVKRH